MESKIRIYLVRGKSVKIIKRYTHTYLVEFIKSKVQISIGHKYLKSMLVENKPQKKQIINQVKLEL